MYLFLAHLANAQETNVELTGLGVRLGLAICYDVRFPELFRKLAEARADILAVPAAFTAFTGKAHWEVLLRARAMLIPLPPASVRPCEARWRWPR